MRIFLVNTDYEPFLESLYGQHPRLTDAPYQEQLEALDSSLFGTADFLRKNLQALGHCVVEAHANNRPLQARWAREHAPRGVQAATAAALRRRPAMYRILAAQIGRFRPDVVLNLDLRTVPSDVLRRAAPQALLVGHHGATAFEEASAFRQYDLVVSQVRPTVEFFRTHGIRAEELRLGFEPRILELLEPLGSSQTDIAFVGSLFPGVHDGRIHLLEQVCSAYPQTGIWSASVDHLPADSAIRRCYRGQAWGKPMYEVFRSARVVLNRHGDDFAYADNCRLYEATGVGAFLLTEAHDNLSDLFEPGIEVGTYRDDEECLAEIGRHLDDETRRARIAAAGQARTLRDHTYRLRMAELAVLLEPLVRRTEA